MSKTKTTIINVNNNIQHIYIQYYFYSLLIDINNKIDIEPENVFDINYDYATEESEIPQRNTGNSIFINEFADQDNNNNSIMPINMSNTTNNGNVNDIEIPLASISKGDYSYRKISNVPYSWAGPNYWKPHYRSSSLNKATKKNLHQKKKIIEKPLFTINENNNVYDEDLDNDGFIKFTSKEAKRIRNCRYKQWNSEKLRLPPCLNIPKDFFYTYSFEPSHNVFEPHHQIPDETPEQNDEFNFNNDDDDYVRIFVFNINFSQIECLRIIYLIKSELITDGP